MHPPGLGPSPHCASSVSCCPEVPSMGIAPRPGSLDPPKSPKVEFSWSPGPLQPRSRVTRRIKSCQLAVADSSGVLGSLAQLLPVDAPWSPGSGSSQRGRAGPLLSLRCTWAPEVLLLAGVATPDMDSGSRIPAPSMARLRQQEGVVVPALPIRLGKCQRGSATWDENRGPGSRAEGQLGVVGQAGRDQGCAASSRCFLCSQAAALDSPGKSP